MEELIDKLKVELIEALNLEEITPEDIDSEAPLFGDDGLGLDVPWQTTSPPIRNEEDLCHRSGSDFGHRERSGRKPGFLKSRETRYGENHPFPHRT